ncbi:MAG: GNAT family N-acetyltransferase [Clostridia bacterium]|nr:GNAT family N-acetyltransferase [Clostridia bacterium]
MLTLFTPEYKDLWFRQTMLADSETMSYNHAWGGTIPFPEEDWREWYDFWIVKPEGKRFYRYLKDDSGYFAGEVAYHYDPELKGYAANVIVYSEFRGRGFGGTALDLLCAAAKENGITELYDDIAADNPAYVMFIRHGFTEVSRTEKKIILKKVL